MSQHPRATLGLVSIFGSTFLELIGYFMLMPLLLFRLKADGVPTSVAGLFAASGYLGMFLMTPFASAVTQRLGRRQTLWLAAAVPVVAASASWRASTACSLLPVLPTQLPTQLPHHRGVPPR